MAINKEDIKKALDDFESDDFVESKDKLQKEIRKSVNTYLKDKLDLKQDVKDVEKTD